MDIETGELQSLSHSDYTSAGDIVGLPDGLLYWSVREDNRLVVVDPKSGVAQPLDPTDYYGVYGLGYANGDLWGFSSKGHALVYDTTTGSVTESYPLSGDWWGATTNPGLWKAP
jgi:glutamine cyclotransferase